MFKKLLMVVGAGSLLLVGSCTIWGVAVVNALGDAMTPEVEKAYKRVETDIHNERAAYEFERAEYEERRWLEPEPPPSEYDSNY